MAFCRVAWCFWLLSLAGLRGQTVGRNDGRWLMVIVYHYLTRDNKLEDYKGDDDDAKS